MSVNRRLFLKGTALAAGVLASQNLARTVGLEKNNKVYAATVGERLEDLYDMDVDIPRYNERNTMFNRGTWDPPVMEYAPNRRKNMIKNIASDATPGYQAMDYALRNAGWAAVNLIGSGTGAGTAKPTYYPSGVYVNEPKVSVRPPKPVELTPERAAHVVKKAAKTLGADLVGIAALDERWLYSHWYSMAGKVGGPILVGDYPVAAVGEDGTLGIPSAMKYVITLAFKQDMVVQASPTPVGAVTVGRGYLEMAVVSYAVAEFLWGLGYGALPAGNDLAIGAPHAVASGMGEMGRNGLLVTPEYGPNIRLAKVLTDLPMVVDKPKDFGVRKFCEVCKKCARECPVGAISEGGMTKDPVCASNLRGTLRWQANVEKCFKFWNDNGESCAVCQGVCPYTKDTSLWTHAMGAKLAPTFGAAFVSLDDLLGYGRIDSQAWWEAKN